MPSFTPKLKQLLRDAGCTFERQGKGDHEIWFSPITGMSPPERISSAEGGLLSAGFIRKQAEQQKSKQSSKSCQNKLKKPLSALRGFAVQQFLFS
jgi:hypothetical protein